MAKLLYVGTSGTDDPTRATFPFLMAKGAIDTGHETGIILMGEAASLIKDSLSQQVRAPSLPAVKIVFPSPLTDSVVTGLLWPFRIFFGFSGLSGSR